MKYTDGWRRSVLWFPYYLGCLFSEAKASYGKVIIQLLQKNNRREPAMWNKTPNILLRNFIGRQTSIFLISSFLVFVVLKPISRSFLSLKIIINIKNLPYRNFLSFMNKTEVLILRLHESESSISQVKGLHFPSNKTVTNSSIKLEKYNGSLTYRTWPIELSK